MVKTSTVVPNVWSILATAWISILNSSLPLQTFGGPSVETLVDQFGEFLIAPLL